MTDSPIRALCTSSGLTQRAVAKLLHVSTRTLRRWCADPASKSYREPPRRAVEHLKYAIKDICDHKHICENVNGLFTCLRCGKVILP